MINKVSELVPGTGFPGTSDSDLPQFDSQTITIQISGPIASGKTKVLLAVKQALEAQGIAVQTTDFTPSQLDTEQYCAESIAWPKAVVLTERPMPTQKL